jgi:hypothetical protein
MTAVTVDLHPAVTYTRPTDPTTFRPLPAGYTPDRLTIKRATHVAAGDLVVGSADQPVHHPYRRLRWATYLCAPWIANPAPADADCDNCRTWRCGNTDPTICLFPHVQYEPNELVAVITPAPGAVPVLPAVPCVHTCPGGGRVTGSYVRCGDCHARPCATCLTSGTSTH